MQEEVIQVLLVEDDDIDARAVVRHLERTDYDYRFTRVTRVELARRALADHNYDAVLLDLSLPDGSGIEVVRGVREANPHVALIILTGLDSDRVALDAVREGAQDFLYKGSLSRELLDRAIRHAIERQRVRDENERLVKQTKRYDRRLKRRNRRLRQLVDTAQRFVDDVSHEFRTPLTVVTEYVSLLQEGDLGPVNEEQLQFLDVIADRVGDLSTMVDDMLDSSRLQAGILGLERAPCTVAGIVDHVWPSLVRKAEVKGVTLERDVPDDLPDVFGDAEKIGRILVNLVVNAIKFSRDPGHVLVSVEPDESGEDVWIRITDNGPGMSPEQLEEVFERFRQLGTATRSSTKGFGLGLSIVRELVDLNLGRMDVRSEVDRGSTFSFCVPVNDTVVVADRFVDRQVRAGKRKRRLSVVVASTDDTTPETAADELDAFWRYVQRQDVIRFRAATNRWVMLLPISPNDVEGYIRQLGTSHESINRNRPGPALPDVAFENHGCWALTTQREAFLSAVARAGRTIPLDQRENNDVQRRIDSTSSNSDRRRRQRHPHGSSSTAANGRVRVDRGDQR